MSKWSDDDKAHSDRLCALSAQRSIDLPHILSLEVLLPLPCYAMPLFSAGQISRQSVQCCFSDDHVSLQLCTLETFNVALA